MTANWMEAWQEAQSRVSGTIGEDVMTVHALVDDQPVCGATGEVEKWYRAVTCADCLAQAPA